MSFAASFVTGFRDAISYVRENGLSGVFSAGGDLMMNVGQRGFEHHDRRVRTGGVALFALGMGARVTGDVSLGVPTRSTYRLARPSYAPPRSTYGISAPRF